MNIQLNGARPYQVEALQNIFKHDRCLVKMFCGTGKSRVIVNTIQLTNAELSVVVFPSLALINQFSTDYLNHPHYVDYFLKHNTINVSTEELTNMESTTDALVIQTFLKSSGPKIVLVTYQSFKVLLENLNGQRIGLVCYDEAHHVVSPETQKLVFGTPYFLKEVFFTATPRNENGITMFDRDDPSKNMCGPVAYEYTYLQGVNEEYLNKFDVCIDMYTDNTNNSIYDAIFRASVKRGTNKVLSYHSGVNGEGNTKVWNFVKDEVSSRFYSLVQDEFPEKVGFYKKITVKGMDGTTSAADRLANLNALEACPADEIYIICSCETIGEGVDTKKANMCVFADPKVSITKIIQNIGRVVRPNPLTPVSTILIPCWINKELYAAAGDDKEKKDEIIRQEMRYSFVLNVLAALKQEDPELYDMCLNYPSRKHKEASLAEQGWRIADGEGEDEDGHEDDDDEYSGETYSPEEVDEMKSSGETPLEIHTNDTIERFNVDDDDSMDEPLLRLYHDEDEDVYKPIVRDIDGEDDRTIIKPPSAKKQRVNLDIYQSDDIRILWGVKDTLDFSKKFTSVVIECQVSFNEEQWRSNLKAVCLYMDKHKQRPSSTDKNVNLKKLGSWICNQKTNYVKNIGIMKNPVIRTEWEATLKKYREYLIYDGEERWRSTLKAVCLYMNEHKKSPSRHDRNVAIKKLGSWICHQKERYANNAEIMKVPVVRAEWEATLEKYGEYLIFDSDEQWRSTLKQVCLYMDDNKKSPSSTDENVVIRKLGVWIRNLKKKYAKKIGIMKRPDMRTEWEAMLEKYYEYLADADEKWHLTLKQVCLYMDKFKKSPSNSAKNKATKKLGTWVTNQKKKYTTNTCIMIKPDIKAEWEATLEKYSEYLLDFDERWLSNLKQVCLYMDEHKKLPSSTDTNVVKRKLGKWVNMQKTNYAQNKDIMKKPDIRLKWEATLKKYGSYLAGYYELWHWTLKEVCAYMDDQKDYPRNRDKNLAIKKLGTWVQNQKTNYAQFKNIMQNPDVRSEWEATLLKYGAYLKQEIIPLPEAPPAAKKRKLALKKQTAIASAVAAEQATEPPHPHHFPSSPSAIGQLHKTYHKTRSDNMHAQFKANPQLWTDYHATRKRTFDDYEPAFIPANRIINELEQIRTKRRKIVVDMGCGLAPIAHHFLAKDDARFTFFNYDHVSGGDPIILSADIAALPLNAAEAEIAIMSLALWGTSANCEQYIKEAFRVLESGGRLYISDSTKKWSPEPLTQENAGQLLRALLVDNGFRIVSEDVTSRPFCFFVCDKIY